ncbi:MAG: tRNA (N6-isopentenyl adenosine(37)-C2)-methylthiotransferase MiaB [bacterium]
MDFPTFFIETLGCQMNEQDSLRMRHRLAQAGYRPASRPEEADVLIVNTCSIRQKAEDKAYSVLGRYRLIKKSRPGCLIAVAGCLAQQKGEALLERVPDLDLVFGPRRVIEVDRLLEECRQRPGTLVAPSRSAGGPDELDCPGVTDETGLKAYVTIMEGCDNGCSYCIVPRVRGRKRSRPHRSIREEALQLVSRGVREITVLGQNVTAYRCPEDEHFAFPELLNMLCRIDGLERLRFTTSHPKDTGPELIECFGRLAPLCEHVHLPLQSGSDRMLRAMRRGYTLEEYLETIRALRDRVPEIAVTSDIIVGFPGEEEKDFEDTLEAIRAIRFDNLFSFKFSPRPGTRASLLARPLPESEKARRLEILQDAQRAISLSKNRRLEQTEVEVLVEGRSRSGDQWTGRTRTNKIVNFAGPVGLFGSMRPVTIVHGGPNSLLGRL